MRTNFPNIRNIFLAAGIFIFLYGCDLSNPGGVLTNNQIPNSVWEYIDRKGILEDEYLIAYYDVTITLDNSESAILTNKNVIYNKSGRISKIPLSQIDKVDDERCMGLCIHIFPMEGPTMTITIALLNGGNIFLDLLLREWEKERQLSSPNGIATKAYLLL